MGLSFNLRALRSARPNDAGTTLVELLVVLVIISILAVVAAPVAATSAQRNKEFALRETLRDVRTALDQFNADWKAEIIPNEHPAASANGWPVSFEVMVEGVEDSDGTLRRYLRKVPRNPFQPKGQGVQGQWRILGYSDPVDVQVWNGEDIYDLRPLTDRVALDGTAIAEW